MTVPAKASARIVAGLKQFQPVLQAAKDRDVNESDTVVIVTDMLCYLFGYDKYSEVTSEHAIRGTFCDIAVKVEGQLAFLVEVKPVGAELKETYVKQAVDYAANQGVDWVVLTNGGLWQVYRIGFTKPITSELVLQLDVLSANARRSGDVESLFLLSREAWQRSKLDEYRDQREAVSRYSMAAIILSDNVLEIVRRELRRLSKNVKVELDDVRSVLENEVLKREVLEGDRAVAAKKLVARAASKSLRKERLKPSLPTAAAPGTAQIS